MLKLNIECLCVDLAFAQAQGFDSGLDSVNRLAQSRSPGDFCVSHHSLMMQWRELWALSPSSIQLAPPSHEMLSLALIKGKHRGVETVPAVSWSLVFGWETPHMLMARSTVGGAFERGFD